MTGEDERDTESARELHGHITAVSVVTVDDIPNGVFTLYELDGLVNIFIQMKPQQFLPHIFPAAALDAHNAKTVFYLFNGMRVILGNGLVVDKPGKQVHLPDGCVFREMPAKFQDILDLASRVGIPSHLGILIPDKSVNAEHLYVKTFILQFRRPLSVSSIHCKTGPCPEERL